MLGGIDPIIIFQFSKLAPTVGTALSKIPFAASVPTLVAQPPIPVYLNEQRTGVYIQAEDKNVDIQTDLETLPDGTAPQVNQKGIANVVSIDILGKKDSIGLALLSSLIDLVFDRSTSQEYAITYMHGAITIFRGLLHSFSVNQTADNDLLTIKLELSVGQKNPKATSGVPTVSGQTNLAIPVGS